MRYEVEDRSKYDLSSIVSLELGKIFGLRHVYSHPLTIAGTKPSSVHDFHYKSRYWPEEEAMRQLEVFIETGYVGEFKFKKHKNFIIIDKIDGDKGERVVVNF